MNENTEGWDTTRVGKVELAVLRLGAYELRYDDDIPDGVAINEAVEIAKKYGQESSGGFVNAILAKIMKSVSRIQNVVSVRQLNTYIKNMFTQDYFLQTVFVKVR